MKKYHSILLILVIIFATLLRFPLLDRVPQGIYSDEVSQGYNAYSILRTGHDEYGTYLPISIRSFGDWKPPLQTYLMIPSIALFGLTAWGVRLPSAFFGTASIYILFILSKEVLALSENTILKRRNYEISLISALLLAISPWHILQSRAAMLVIIELFFFMLATWCFLRGFKNLRWWYISAVSFVLALYSYYGMRLITPIFFTFLLIFFRRKIIANSRKVVGPAVVAIFLLMPLIIAFFIQPDVVMGRAKTVSIFFDRGVSLTVWELIAQDGPAIPSKLAQFLHNRPYHYTVDIVRRFFQHFDGSFLFIVGDRQLPFQIPNMGILYIADGIFVLVGCIYLVRKNELRVLSFLGFWTFVSILPAALTFTSPVTNRTFTAIFPVMFLSSIGIVYFFEKHKSILSKMTIIGIYTFCFVFFIWNYFYILPYHHTDWWLGGYQKLFEHLSGKENNYNSIAISGKASVPYIFLLYYRQIDPATVRDMIHRNNSIDDLGFEHVDSFGKYRFPRHFDWEKDGERLPNQSLLVLTPDEKFGSAAQKIDTINYPDGRVAFILYEINQQN